MAYLPLSTANLPDPVIDPAQDASPSDYFNTVLYTGTGTTQSITGVGFQPDFIWWKGRNASSNHLLMNAVVGNTRYLSSNTTGAEQTDGTNVLTSFDTDGFTVPDDTGGYANFSGRTYVAWNWKANGSGVSNNVGTIPSTVSANTTSGFSIVSYTGTNVAGTIGHGLGAEAQMVIVKARDYVDGWYVQHTGMTSASHYQTLNNANADALASTVWNGSYPTSTVFNVGTSNAANKSGTNYIAYVFANVEGFSKFGSYTGNGSTDGTFCYTGFRPAFVMVKCTSTTARSWSIKDSTRDSYNLSDANLSANYSDAEGSTEGLDILSNGFKCRTSGADTNTGGQTYIYMAFAENPFKYSNAR